MIWIDFHGSTHGHFLEYVINAWIMGMPRESQSVFTNTGACHNFSEFYKNNKIVNCGHWWWTDYKHQQPNEPVIRITIDRFDNRLFYIGLVNRWYRSGDVGFEQKLLEIPETVRNDPVMLREQYFYKYQDRDRYVDHYREFTAIPNPIHQFPFAAFFSWSKFCVELQKIANFLGQKFDACLDLFTLWQQFIALNQGYQSYQHCESVLQIIFDQNKQIINLTSYEEAWICYRLAEMTGHNVDTLLTAPTFPAYNKDIYETLNNHV